MDKASAKYRESPDVYFRDAHKLIVRIVTNIVSDPDEPKFRSINMQGKAFKSISDCQGAIEVLLHLGFKMDQGHLVLPAGNEIAPEALDFLLRIEEIREKEKLERAEREHNAKKASKEAKSKAMAERIEKDQIEARQKLAVGSTSKLVPFSGRDKVGLKDIGAGDAAKGG